MKKDLACKSLYSKCSERLFEPPVSVWPAQGCFFFAGGGGGVLERMSVEELQLSTPRPRCNARSESYEGASNYTVTSDNPVSRHESSGYLPAPASPCPNNARVQTAPGVVSAASKKKCKKIQKVPKSIQTWHAGTAGSCLYADLCTHSVPDLAGRRRDVARRPSPVLPLS